MWEKKGREGRREDGPAVVSFHCSVEGEGRVERKRRERRRVSCPSQ
jgi:hypothetical protein